MHITELKIAGFKSFVDPVSVPIHAGLTGVVGPNGCGKSNVLESLRWVMGASSARAMRGGEMDDLIFSGSSTRPARETAEVVMVLDNSDRRAPPQFNDIDTLEVMRRLKRGAGSTYKLNGRTVRGKDIQLLFADASTGANSPALVRQGQISEMINSKPQNRRRILEEAAGISGLNSRRHEAELKLKSAEQNLERLTEVSVEVERQLGSLKRQAAKARKYLRLSDEIRGLDALLAHRRWESARTALEDAKTRIETLRGDVERLAIEDAVAERQMLETREALDPLRLAEVEAAGKVGQAKIALTRLENDRKNAAQAVDRLKQDISRLEGDLSREQGLLSDATATRDRLIADLARLPADDPEAFAREEDHLKGALTLASEELEAAEAAANSASERLSDMKARRDAAKSALDDLTRAQLRAKSDHDRLEAEFARLAPVDDLETALATAREAADTANAASEAADKTLAELEPALEAAQTEQADAEAPVKELEARLGALQAEIRGLERLLRRADVSARPIIDDVRANAGFEKALAAALGDDLSAPADPSAPSYWGASSTRDRDGLPDGVTPLSDYVSAPGELAARLSQCGVVTGDQGEALQVALRVGQRLVSREGHLWRWDGFVRTPRAPVSAAERLEQQSRLEAASREVADIENELSRLKTTVEAARALRQEKEAALKTARQEAPGLYRAAVAARDAVSKAEQALDRAAVRRDSLSEARRAASERLTDANEGLERAQAAMVTEDVAPLEAQLSNAREAVRAARTRETAARDKLADRQRERDRLAGRRRGLDRDIRDWSARVESAEARLASLATSRDEAAERLETASLAPDDVVERIEALSGELETLEADRKRIADDLAQAETSLREAETSARTAKDAAVGAREGLVVARTQLENAETRMEEVGEQARVEFSRAPEGLFALAESAIEEAWLETDTGEIQVHLEGLKRDRHALGGVNPDAEAEAEELAERLGTQAAEREDLVAAIGKLREGIDALNSEGRGRLLEAFEKVNGHFQTLFSTLFAGGQAELRLTDSDDPLSAGLEIFAQPPGKRLGTLSLMSGGEQALTAASLIFAVFLSNPAPICVLDEVDAPLDDANVDRFCRLLDEMRQRTETRFVVITHNPVTMSRMDRLFGVTMQERGVSRLVSVDLSAAEQMVAAQ